MAKKIGKYFVYCHTNIPMELMNVFFNYVIFLYKRLLRYCTISLWFKETTKYKHVLVVAL